MTISVELNPRFKFLNNNNFKSNPKFGNKERRMIVDIDIASFEAYVTGGFPIDVSTIRNFTEIYVGTILHHETNFFQYRIIPAVDNAASGLRLGVIFTSDGEEIPPLGISAHVVTVELVGM